MFSQEKRTYIFFYKERKFIDSLEKYTTITNGDVL